MEANSLSQI